MVHSSDPETPYWYARVIGIFHADVKYGVSNQYSQMEFLWVRWFHADSNAPFDIKNKRLPRVGFLDGNEKCAFGFINPADVIRAVHLIPAFHLGRTTKILGKSQLARNDSDGQKDWKRYYVGM
jgi:hypothetical protein